MGEHVLEVLLDLLDSSHHSLECLEFLLHHRRQGVPAKLVDFPQELLHTNFLRLDRLDRRWQVDEILDDFPALIHFIHCHVRFSRELDQIILVHVNNDEDRVRGIFLENMVDLNIILLDSHTSSVPSNYCFVDVDLVENIHQL